MKLARALALGAALLAGATLGGCGDATDDGTPLAVEPSVPDPNAEDFCNQEWPHESWATFGQGFLTTYCRGCHGADTADRAGAPPGIDFDTEEESLALKDRILARTITAGDMPPAGGPPPEALVRLRIWLECSVD